MAKQTNTVTETKRSPGRPPQTGPEAQETAIEAFADTVGRILHAATGSQTASLIARGARCARARVERERVMRGFTMIRAALDESETTVVARYDNPPEAKKSVTRKSIRL